MDNFIVKQCLGILLTFCIISPSSFAQDSKTTPAPATTVATAPVAPAVNAGAQDKPRVFVTDEPLHEGNVMVHGRAASAHVESGPNARVVEIQADLVKVCPHVTVTNRPDMADFTLLFRREGGKRSAMFAFGGLAGLALSASSKVDGASLFSANGDLVTATKQRTVENAIREICASIPPTVAHDSAPPVPAQAPAPVADTAALPVAPTQPAPAQPAATVQIAVTSTPDGADIEIDGGFVGNTPSSIETTLGDHIVLIHKKGFKDWERKVKVSGGSISLRADLDAAGL